MSSQYIKILVPPPVASPRGARWAANAAVWIARAALATRAIRWVHGSLQRLRERDERNSGNDVLALARRVEREMPSLATELRFIAMRRPEAPD